MPIRVLPFILLCAFAWVTKSAIAGQFPLEIIERFADARIVVYVQQSDIDKEPSWDPSSGEPPLTIAQLVKKVQAWQARDAKLASATIRKIELKPILHHQKQDRWYYLIQLKKLDEEQPGTYYLAVLMSGKIVPAIKEPESYK
jgi:hypothetical protein